MDFLGAGPDHLTFRFGLQWREPLRSARPPDGLLPARYIRIQAASPPPERVDGTQWDDGLVVPGGGRFIADLPIPTDAKVDPLDGVAPLGRPDPTTIVLDRWLAVPALPSSRALTRTFEIGTADPTIRPLSFLSAPYPDASIDGKRLAVVGVDYYYEGRIEFDRMARTSGLPSAWNGSSHRSGQARTSSCRCRRSARGNARLAPEAAPRPRRVERPPVDHRRSQGHGLTSYFCQPIVSGVAKKRPAP